MEPRIFTTVFVTIFAAELGDKTQLATLLYATQAGSSKLTVFVASAAALGLASGLAVLVGSFFSQHVSPRLLSWAAGLGFVGVGLWTIYRA